jgi:hypothetical protein
VDARLDLAFHGCQLRQTTLPNEQVGGLIVHKLNYLNMGKAPAQCRRNDQNYRDHTEITEFLSNERMLSHCSEFLLTRPLGV